MLAGQSCLSSGRRNSFLSAVTEQEVTWEEFQEHVVAMVKAWFQA